MRFFEGRGHRVLPSSSLVPAHDPTLLFSNAGMNQFKDVFLGREKRDYSRAATSQKCVRAGGKHNDLEQVGRTTRHHTFFEMLGNFSFGDYFKKDAIPWAWELVTKDFAIARDKLYITIFEGATIPHADIPRDTEAYDCWRAVGVPADRIFELGMQENFWQMGDTGPCGPCSEIHYDLGPGASDLGHTDCEFPCDCGRFVEIWNLVFMQYDRSAGVKDGVSWYQFSLLPKPCVDTGMGLERIAAVLQRKKSNYDTDLFRPLIDEAAGLANVEYGTNHDTDVSLRIIADHARAATFLISDGVLPSNEGRGYVLRKIMRRAVSHGRKLGLEEPFLYSMAGHVAQMMKGTYPELADSEQHVARVIKAEEIRFARTLDPVLKTLERSLAEARRREIERLIRSEADEIARERARNEKMLRDAEQRDGPSPHLEALRKKLTGALRKLEDRLVEARSDLDRNLAAAERRFVSTLGEDSAGQYQPVLSGTLAFKFYDTYGLPLDFMIDAARDQGIRFDKEGFDRALAEQRERARASWKGVEKKAAPPVFLKLTEEGRTVFDGYAETTSTDCRIVALVVGRRGGSRTAPTAPPVISVEAAGASGQVEIILDHTPFYAEAGGQVGDVGQLLAPDGDREVAHVTDTYYPVSGLIVHKAVARDVLRVGDLVTAKVDLERRDATRRNHTATHLLHAALRKTLGTHVKQAGSLVAPDRLRFDFTHYAALDEQDLLDIEDLVNEHILKNEEVVTTVMDLDGAVNSGAMALFGEKYADQVRVLSIDDFSKELCGGTHVRRTGDIGLFKIVSEGSVAAGTRRIEAVTGEGVLKYLRQASETLALLADSLHAKPEELLPAVEKLTESERKLRKELEAQQMKRAASQAGDLAKEAREVKGVRVVSARVEVTDRSAMRQMVDDLRAKLQSGVIVLGSVSDGKVSLVAAVTKDLTNRLDAGKIVKQAAAYVEGSGGGRRDLAEAGGKNPARLDESLQAVPAIIQAMLEQ